MNAPALLLDPSIPTYPATLPLPDRAPYSLGVDMGVIRSPMSAGNTRQRRLYRHMPTMFALSFHMHTDELFQWQQWVNAYAYDWFNMPLADMLAGYTGELVTWQPARFAGDLSVQMDGWDWWAVSVACELNPGLLSTLANPADRGWIIGGSPAQPSPDWTIAGTPGSPSIDWTLGGSPGFPGSP